MKTIEEKAKAYDELTAKLKEWYNGLQDGSPAKETLEYLLPQFRESEDERIRQKLLECCDSPTFEIQTGIKNGVLKLWLEKQKEQESITDSIKFEEGFKVGREFERREQKPTPNWMPKFLDELRSKKNYFDWDEHKNIEGHILAIINWIAPNYFEEKEQKPVEWSEEYEKTINDACEHLTRYGNTCCNGVYEELGNKVFKVVDRLKSLRSQPKKSGIVLTEEQEKEFGHLFTRPSQKLSEDQIYTLERICSNLHLKASDDAPKLDEIIEQLKKS